MSKTDLTDINTDALCAAFLAEGFTESPREEGQDERVRSFSRVESHSGRQSVLVIKNPDSTEEFYNERAVDWLFGVCESAAYPEVGGRNNREKALIAQITKLNRKVASLQSQQRYRVLV